MSNSKQLIHAVHLYASANDEWYPMNVHGGEAQSGRRIPDSLTRYYPWVMGWLDWSISSHNTNRLFLQDNDYSVLARFSGNTAAIFKCPADTRISRAQRARGWTERARSVSMNGAVGKGNKSANDYLLQCEKIYQKTTDVTNPGPSKLFVFLDEHPDGINDGAFFNPRTDRRWIDLPANYHNNACSFAFADGHFEMKKWQSSVPKDLVDEFYTPPLIREGDPDWVWLMERTSAPPRP